MLRRKKENGFLGEWNVETSSGWRKKICNGFPSLSWLTTRWMAADADCLSSSNWLNILGLISSWPVSTIKTQRFTQRVASQEKDEKGGENGAQSAILSTAASERRNRPAFLQNNERFLLFCSKVLNRGMHHTVDTANIQTDQVEGKKGYRSPSQKDTYKTVTNFCSEILHKFDVEQVALPTTPRHLLLSSFPCFKTKTRIGVDVQMP